MEGKGQGASAPRIETDSTGDVESTRQGPRIKGRSPEAERLRRERAAARYRERYQNDPEFRAKEKARWLKRAHEQGHGPKYNEKRRGHYQRHKTKLNSKRAERERRRKASDASYRKRKAEYQLQWYQKHRDAHKERAKTNRRKRDPFVGIKTAIDACKRGDIDSHELYRQVSGAYHATYGATEQEQVQQRRDGNDPAAINGSHRPDYPTGASDERPHANEEGCAENDS